MSEFIEQEIKICEVARFERVTDDTPMQRLDVSNAAANFILHATENYQSVLCAMKLAEEALRTCDSTDINDPDFMEQSYSIEKVKEALAAFDALEK